MNPSPFSTRDTSDANDIGIKGVGVVGGSSKEIFRIGTLGTPSPGHLEINTSQGDIILKPSGNVGIGTTSPDSTLHVIGGVCVESSDTGCSAPAGRLRIGSNIELFSTTTTTPTQTCATRCAEVQIGAACISAFLSTTTASTCTDGTNQGTTRTCLCSDLV
jgi:hypothetical protein